jgi:hypothetical protein
MRTWILLFAPLFLSAADDAALQQLFDAKLSPTLRANACFELRGRTDREAIVSMARALDDPDLLSCAADNLRIAGAIGPLAQALSASQNAQVRAAAARELGAFQKPELLEPLSLAAQDENALVATNALAGLSQYQDAAVLPYLVKIAQRGGMTGDMALDRVAQLDPGAALGIARDLLASSQVPDKLYAIRILGSFGGAPDLPELRKLAASNQENLAQRDRGFGFMPAISLARAAQSAVATIESRVK